MMRSTDVDNISFLSCFPHPTPQDALHRVNGTYSLTLALTGTAASLYLPPTPLTVGVLAAGQPLTIAPALASCVYGQTGG